MLFHLASKGPQLGFAVLNGVKMCHLRTIGGNAMRKAGQAIVLEFNELCPSLINQFMEAGKLPNFAQLHGESQVFVTEASANSYQRFRRPEAQFCSCRP
jgi:hypothetical protein